jgi:hypothetical protein
LLKTPNFSNPIKVIGIMIQSYEMAFENTTIGQTVIGFAEKRPKRQSIY